eukprot:scaffold39756_cov44-Phaeocystis_antarctica.AAC.1
MRTIRVRGSWRSEQGAGRERSGSLVRSSHRGREGALLCCLRRVVLALSARVSVSNYSCVRSF